MNENINDIWYVSGYKKRRNLCVQCPCIMCAIVYVACNLFFFCFIFLFAIESLSFQSQIAHKLWIFVRLPFSSQFALYSHFNYQIRRKKYNAKPIVIAERRKNEAEQYVIISIFFCWRLLISINASFKKETICFSIVK